MKQFSVIVIGAGSRGSRYTDIMATEPEKFKVVGVAEPIPERREYIKTKHSVPENNCFESWENILAVPKFADIAIISTMDRMHREPAIKALEAGYDLLLEKPVAPTPEDCAEILKKAKECGRKIIVCHVLRYSPFFMNLKKIITDGTLGEIMSVEHIEAVGNLHQSHSFVRGNWGNENRSSFMLLQKCCHDLDILQWLLDKNCQFIQSFGSKDYFRVENAPAGAPERCTDGCPHADTCYYNAIKLYYDDKENLWFRESSTQKHEPTDEQVMEMLKTTQYGKCVYRCDNDVVDHQTVNMKFDGGTTVAMTMSAFTKGGRRLKIMGTKGELDAIMDAEPNKAFEFFDFATRESRFLNSDIDIAGDSIVSGHGGGDEGIVDALYDYINDTLKTADVSEIGVSCRNHMLVFAAEESRRKNTVVDVSEYLNKYL